MIYPLQRPVQPVFNSAAAIRNTLTLDFDGDVKEAWKLLCAKRPHCLHTCTRMTHIHTHAGATIEIQCTEHSKTFIKSISCSFLFFLVFSARQEFIASFQTATPSEKTLIYDYSLKEPWIKTVLSTLSKLMVCRKLWKHRWRR